MGDSLGSPGNRGRDQEDFLEEGLSGEPGGDSALCGQKAVLALALLAAWGSCLPLAEAATPCFGLPEAREASSLDSTSTRDEAAAASVSGL